jgi:hypothetical protein
MPRNSRKKHFRKISKNLSRKMPKKIIQISPYSFDHPGGVEQYARTLQEIFPDEMITLAGGSDFPIVEPVKHCPLPCFWK